MLETDIAPSTEPIHDQERHDILKSLRISRVILPVLLGIGGVAYLFYRQFDAEQFHQIHWTTQAFGWIGLAFLLLLVRHGFYAFRLRAITDNIFSWRKCLELIVLWEFSSALTPTSKGGPFVMLFVLTQEKLAAGRTAAAVFYAMICDSGFFIILLPILLSVFGPNMLYPGMHSYKDVGLASGTFFATYTLMTLYWLFLMFFLLFRPQYIERGMHWLADRRLLRRFSPKLHRVAKEFSLAAYEIRSQDWRYHLKVIIGTVGAWTCKFIMINCLIIAVVPSTPVDGTTQIFIYARLIAMFIIMTFSPTPGGAGLAEIALASFLSDYVPHGIGMVVALLWRGMAYYGYLLVGSILVPAWVNSHLFKHKQSTNTVPADA